MAQLKVVFLIMLSFLISGCWDVEEIDRRDLVLAMGLDAVSDSLIRTTLQIPLTEYTLPPAAGSESKAKKFYTLTAEGHTIIGAAAKEQANSHRTIMTGQLKFVLFQETLAREGVKKHLDYLARMPKIPRSADIYISREPAAQLLEQVPIQETLPGLVLPAQLESPLKRDQTYPMHLWHFLQRLDDPGVDPYAPVLSYDLKNQTLQIIGLAVFRHDRLVGFLDPEQTRMFGMVTGNLKGGYLELPVTEREFIAFRSVNARVKIIPRNTQPLRFKVKLTVSASLIEFPGVPRDLEEPNFKKIEAQCEAYLKRSSLQTIKLLQSWEADILDFGLEYRNHYQPEFNPRTWRQEFKDAKVDVAVDFKISRMGLYH